MKSNDKVASYRLRNLNLQENSISNGFSVIARELLSVVARNVHRPSSIKVVSVQKPGRQRKNLEAHDSNIPV